jgi:beta-barrel assembly-enhancing protease
MQSKGVRIRCNCLNLLRKVDSDVIMKRTACLVLSIMLYAPAAQGQIDLGRLVQNAGATVGSLRNISEAEEIQLGNNLAGVILGAAPLIIDPAKQRTINQLGSWLAMHSERPNLPWKFGIVESDDFNAFSTPGGIVLISNGLFDRMRTESELAGVLAHEIAHVVKKHHLDALQKDIGTSLLSGIAVQPSDSLAPPDKSLKAKALSAVRLARNTAAKALMVTSKLIDGGRTMFLRGLDKEDEYEADRMAVIIAARSGYSPYGLVGVLQTLSAEPTVGRFALMSRTHPKPVDRIDRLDTAMGTQLDMVPGLVDDLPRFVALRNPIALVVPAKKGTAKLWRRGP